MINLLSVKKYNTYDFVQDTLPASDGTWLCTLPAGSYTEGHSYNVESGTATRIEAQEDMRIEESIHSTIEAVFKWLNNPFYTSRSLQENDSLSERLQDELFFPVTLRRKWISYYSDTAYYTFNASGTIDGVKTGTFVVGDLVNIEGALRNNVVGYVTDVTGEVVTIDNPNMKTTMENAIVFLSDIPVSVERAIAQMINWDVFLRELSDKQSENIGNYSYSKGTARVGDLEYPTSLVASLNAYRRVNFVA